jgi:hypothetical protein
LRIGNASYLPSGYMRDKTMGVSYTAYTFYGVEIPRDRLYREVTLRGCEHPLPPGANYCPVCGKVGQVTAIRPIPDWDGGKRLAGLKVLGTTPDITSQSKRLFACNSFVEVDSREDGVKRVSTDFADQEREEIRLHLEPLDLWDSEGFGLWTLLYCSY